MEKKNILSQIKKRTFIRTKQIFLSTIDFITFVHSLIWSENYDTRFIIYKTIESLSILFFFFLSNSKSIIFATRNIFLSKHLYIYRNRYIAKIFSIRSFNNRFTRYLELFSTIFNSFVTTSTPPTRRLTDVYRSYEM